MDRHGTAPPADSDKADAWSLTTTNFILQNPSCFSAELRANAQTLQDLVKARRSDDAARIAGRCATAKHWWDC